MGIIGFSMIKKQVMCTRAGLLFKITCNRTDYARVMHKKAFIMHLSIIGVAIISVNFKDVLFNCILVEQAVEFEGCIWQLPYY